MKQLTLFNDEEWGLKIGEERNGYKLVRNSLGIIQRISIKSRLTQEEFIARAKNIWGDQYDYSESVYIGGKKPITIFCKKHQHCFTINMAQNHIKPNGRRTPPTGCPICSYERQYGEDYGPDWRSYLRFSQKQNRVGKISNSLNGRRLDPEEKARRAAERKVKAEEERQLREAKRKQEQEQRRQAREEKLRLQKAETQRRHKEKQARRAAQRQLAEQQRIKAFQEMFLREAPKAQGAEYQYRGVENIKGRSSRVMVHCGNPNHQWHEMLVWLCLDGSKCRECAGRHQPREQRCNTFLKKVYKKYGHNMFDLSRVPEQYVNNDTQIEVKCLEHNYWYKVTPDTFLRKSGGCPICNTSKGEMKIILWLNEHGIKFEKEPIIQHNNPNCKRSYLKPDFWLPDYNLIIEYNGVQHYEDIDHFKKDGEWTLEDQQERDRTMRQLCKDNEWQLLEIPYTEFDRVGEILSENLNLTK